MRTTRSSLFLKIRRSCEALVWGLVKEKADVCILGSDWGGLVPAGSLDKQSDDKSRDSFEGLLIYDAHRMR